MFIIAYDIACPRRLQRTARLLERRAQRCQKSVFVFHGDDDAIDRVLDEASKLISPRQDCIQAWKLTTGETARGRVRGTAAASAPLAVILSGIATSVAKETDQ